MSEVKVTREHREHIYRVFYGCEPQGLEVFEDWFAHGEARTQTIEMLERLAAGDAEAEERGAQKERERVVEFLGRRADTELSAAEAMRREVGSAHPGYIRSETFECAADQIERGEHVK